MNKINITASSIEEYQRLSEKIKELPESTYNQIQSVETGLTGIVCTIKPISENDRRIYIPSALCTQIEDFGDYIGIYAQSFFIKAKKDTFPYSYILI